MVLKVIAVGLYASLAFQYSDILSQKFYTLLGFCQIRLDEGDYAVCGYAVQVCLLHKCTVFFSLALDKTTFSSTQAESKAGWTGLGVKSTVHPWLLHKCTVLFSSALATATYINLAIPHSTPFYCGTKATPIHSCLLWD